MGWLRYCAEVAINDADREFAEQMARELNALNIQIANSFKFQIRTGKVHKPEMLRKVV
jgi:hypothetical protein